MGTLWEQQKFQHPPPRPQKAKKPGPCQCMLLHLIGRKNVFAIFSLGGEWYGHELRVVYSGSKNTSGEFFHNHQVLG